MMEQYDMDTSKDDWNTLMKRAKKHDSTDGGGRVASGTATELSEPVPTIQTNESKPHNIHGQELFDPSKAFCILRVREDEEVEKTSWLSKVINSLRRVFKS